MLSFVVFEPDTDRVERMLRAAHLVGPEDVPIAGEISGEAPGLIRCVKTTGEAAGLSLQVDLDEGGAPDGRSPLEWLLADPPGDDESGAPLPPLGSLVLQTCLLPEREEAYLLSLELARRQIMVFLNCLEEWRLFDLGPESAPMRAFEAARHAFTRALVAQRSPTDGAIEGFCPNADKIARQALRLAVEAGERLALCNAATDFEGRMSGRAYAHIVERLTGAPPKPRQMRPVIGGERAGVTLPMRPAIGCAVSPGAPSEPLQQIVQASCDFITTPMRWIDMEPTEGRYAYADTDRWIEWAVRRARLPVVAGPLIDFRANAVPDWLYIWENDYETLRELVYEHVRSLVTRYRRTISRWTVCSGLHTNENFQLSFEQMMDLTRICVHVVRKLHPQGKVQVEISRPWGEYHTHNRRSLPPTLYAEMLTQAGVQIDAFALRLQVGVPERGLCARDLMSISAMLDRYAALDKPLTISAVGAPSAPITEPPTPPDDPDEQPPSAGRWRAPWSPPTQADWLSAIGAIALAKPYVQSICWQALVDVPTRPEMESGALVDESGSPRPAGDRLRELREGVHAATTPERISPLASAERVLTEREAGIDADAR
ncbi:MAG: endo-1,4-beta-xylanase [Phycisphaerales bacterium]